MGITPQGNGMAPQTTVAQAARPVPVAARPVPVKPKPQPGDMPVDQPAGDDPEGEGEDELCAVMGVFAPLTGIVGTLQAAEALKLAAGVGESLSGKLLMLDARDMQFRTVHVPRDPACAVCGAR